MVRLYSLLTAPSTPHTATQLYKHLLKECKKLPEECRPYYRHYIRQGFNQHSEEIDPERLMQIINRAVEDGKWIIKKYSRVQE